MSKRLFTKEQIEELSRNKNVIKCNERSIAYSRKFKIEAVRQYHEKGMSASDIFKEAGFDLNIIGKWRPKDLLADWRKVYKEKGDAGLLTDNRGKHGKGRPKKNRLEGRDKIEWLEAENAYLKAENAFLAKLRATRAE